MRYNTKKIKKHGNRRQQFGFGAIAVLLLTASVLLYAHYNDPPKKVASTTANSETKGEPPANVPDDSPAPPSETPAPTNPEPPKDPGDTPVASTDLKVPSESIFVSNHHPQIGDAMQSVCNTTAGARCNIVFTKDGVTKSLGDKKVDGGGSAYWDWKVSDLGLTAGSWQVSAVASLGDQTQTAADAQLLEIPQ